MGGECNSRRWEEMIPDALGLIFQKLSFQEVLTVVPRVCKSWGNAVAGPHLWQEIDIEEWCLTTPPQNIDRMLRLLIPRSQGTLRKLCVACLSNKEIFSFIADNAEHLHTLSVSRSEMDECDVDELAGMFSNVTELDISYCNNMGEMALTAFGTRCTKLTSLRRAMHPLEVMDKISQDDEALAIGMLMPNLKQLEIPYMLVSTDCVKEIIKGCPLLELLDIRGCWHVALDEEFLKKFPGLKVVGPRIIDHMWDDYSDDDDDDGSGSSDFYPWDMDDGDDGDDDDGEGLWDVGEGVADVEMWFHAGANSMNAGHDWPPSP